MEKIKILGIEGPAVTNSGKQRWTVKTDQGVMSVWDKAIADGLKGFTGYVDAEIATKGDFRNIKKVLPTDQEPAVTTERVTRQPANLASMYASYAKDIFIALLPESRDKPLNNIGIMQEAIDLVKQAKGAFE